MPVADLTSPPVRAAKGAKPKRPRGRPMMGHAPRVSLAPVVSEDTARALDA